MTKQQDKTEQQYVDELWQFPCDFLFKAMAYAHQDAESQVVEVIQGFVPGDYSPIIKPSSKGTYVSISISFTASSKAQLDDIYRAVNALDCVKVCL